MSESFGANCGTTFQVMTGDVAETMIISMGTGVSPIANHLPLTAAQISALYGNQNAY